MFLMMFCPCIGLLYVLILEKNAWIFCIAFLTYFPQEAWFMISSILQCDSSVVSKRKCRRWTLHVKHAVIKILTHPRHPCRAKTWHIAVIPSACFLSLLPHVWCPLVHGQSVNVVSSVSISSTSLMSPDFGWSFPEKLPISEPSQHQGTRASFYI